MKVNFSKKVQRQFQKKAKEAFPVEEFGILMGTKDKDGDFTINDIYFPPERLDFSSESQVEINPNWFSEANKIGIKNSCKVLGTIHSHCYETTEDDTVCPKASPSYGDFVCHKFLKEQFSGLKFFCVMRYSKYPTRNKFDWKIYPIIDIPKIIFY
jgi:Prokaryotic homologs of the JAB domain